MLNDRSVRSLLKRSLLIIAGLAVFTMVFMLACRLALQSMFAGIEESRATGLSAVAWDARSMWNSGPMFQDSSIDADKSPMGFDSQWISRNAELSLRTTNFDNSTAALRRSVALHHGVFEDLQTRSRSKHGRALSALVSVPSADFEGALAGLKHLGRVEAVSEGGEDIAVKLGSASRHLELAKTNLLRLQKLQRERKGELRDAVALEKEIAQASETVTEAEHHNGGLLSTTAQARIRVFLVEDYRAPMEANLTSAVLEVRNAAIDGLSGIFSSISLFLGVLFQYGLPLLFWIVLHFWPSRAVWRHLRRRATVLSAQ